MGRGIEIRSFIRFFEELKRARKPVVFYSEESSYYKYFEGYIDAILEGSDLEIFYITSSAEDPCFKREGERFRVFYIRSLLPFLMPFIGARALVMTMTELGKQHIKRSIQGAKHVYVFHAVVSTHMQYARGAFDHYDTLFCVGPHHVQEARRAESHYRINARELIATGYPLLEKIHREHQDYLRDSGPHGGEGNKILIAPSWAPGNIMESCLRAVIEILDRHDYYITVRPHPEFKRRREGVLERYREEYRDCKNLEFEIDWLSDRSLHEADVLITDWSGIAFEYAFGTERPVLYIDTPRKVSNPGYEILGIESMESKLRNEIGRRVAPDKIAEIPEVLSSLIGKKDEYREKLIRLRGEYIFNFGKSSKIGAGYLINLYSRDDSVRTAETEENAARR